MGFRHHCPPKLQRRRAHPSPLLKEREFVMGLVETANQIRVVFLLLQGEGARRADEVKNKKAKHKPHLSVLLT